MLIPYIEKESPETNYITEFGGYNHNQIINENEFYDMKNFHCDDYPVASTRTHRGEMRFKLNGEYIDSIVGVCSKDKINVIFKQEESCGLSVASGVPESTTGATVIDGSKKYTTIPYGIGAGHYTLINLTYCPSLVKNVSINATKAVNKLWVTGNTNTISVGSTMSSIPASKIDEEYITIPWAHGVLNYNGHLLVAIGYNAERVCGDNALIPLFPKDSLTIYGGSITDKSVQTALIKSGLDVYFGDENGKIETPAYRIRDKEIDSSFVFENKSITRRVYFCDPNNPTGSELSYSGFTLPRKGMVMYVKVGQILNYSCVARSSTDSSSLLYDVVPLSRSGTIANELVDSLIGKTINYQWATETFTGSAPSSPSSNIYYTNTDTNKTFLYVSGQLVPADPDDNHYSYTIKDIVRDANDNVNAMRVYNPHPYISSGNVGGLTQTKMWIGEYNTDTEEIERPVPVCNYVEGEHQIVEMGAYICIFPEAYQINTVKKNENGQYNEIESLNDSTVIPPGANWRMCSYNGTFYNTSTASQSAPTNPADGQLWIDTSDYPCKTKLWSADTQVWNEFQPYIRIWGVSSTFPTAWKENDAAEMFVLGKRLYDDNVIQAAKDQKYFVISKVGKCNSSGVDDGTTGYSYIQFPCAMNNASIYGGGTNVFTLKRSIPKMDYIIESNNRLWGCRYGNNNDGEMVNEIFASKLGDAKNWHYFSNTTVDSYYVSLGDDGEFTGAITYQNNPMFFREGCFHRIYGQYPSNYQLSTLHTSGVKKGSNKSLSILNEVLYYHSPIGFYAYSGGVPVKVSDNLGKELYHDVVAGSLGNEYHCSCKDKNNNSVVFCFNDYYQKWHKEDDLDVTDFIVNVDEKYALTSDYRLLAIEGTKGNDEGRFDWYIESGDIGYSQPNRKRLLKLVLRLWLNKDTNAHVSIMYDDAEWEHINFIRPMNRIVSLPLAIMPHRCDHFRLRIEGCGDFRLLGVTKYVEGASVYD